MFGPAIGGQPSLTLPSPSSSVLFRHCGPTSGAPTAGQPSLTKPSPSSSRLLLHCAPDSPTPGCPPALGSASGGAAPLIASSSCWSGGPPGSIGCRLEQSTSGLAAGFTGPRSVM